MMVRGELIASNQYEWNYRHLRRIDKLLGRERGQYPPTAFEPLCRAVCGELAALDADQGAGLTRAGRKSWAREQLKAMIDAEVEGLRALRAELDGENEANDRAEAPRRALIDPSKEGQLVRKYEAAAERGMIQALREFHRVEGRAEASGAAAPTPSSTAVPPAGPRDRPRRMSSPTFRAPASRAVAAGSPLPSTPTKTNPTDGGDPFTNPPMLAG